MSDDKESKNEVEEISSSSLTKFEVSNQNLQFASLPAAGIDLRNPPSNWLNGQIKTKSGSNKFSSFVMALDFWRELGDVDVISDSENIKNLLKIPYSDNVISYFVHRVGNTLLIDNFDLAKYLLLKTEEDWQWLRKFICEQVLSQLDEKDRKLLPIRLNKTREFVEQKNLLSKFLYYSIEDSKRIEKKEYVPLPLSQPLLPLPSREEIFDNSKHQFTRNVLWTFEDIRMLIGSDMQIFGNQSRPCISLRLRDMKKPINVLTGIDYWLDNLMCNVPEIFLCFHQNGIVQKYEHIKTEDLPNLEDSKFSPKVIRNVAHNILSFLKANATKAGHTYWLFKGKNDDVVKLYDLTTLQLLASTKYDESCESESSEKKEETDRNPFTIPVAMLLYTVARNMKYSNEKLTAKQAASIKQLLDNCLKLLPRDKYPQIVTSSHYILSDIQIQAGMDPSQPNTEFSEDTEVDPDEFYESFSDNEDSDVREGDDCYTTAVQSICDTIIDSDGEKRKNSRPPPLVLGTIKERCADALSNVIAGLSCLKFCESESMMAQEKQKEKEQRIQEEQNPKLANPDVPIPMGWLPKGKENSKKSKKKKKFSVEETVEQPPSEVQLDSKSLLMKGAPNVKTWNIHLKVLLFEKASLIYACLAEDSYADANFGKSLKYLGMSILCQNMVTKYVPGMATQRNCLYGRAGDCYMQITKMRNKIELIQGFRDAESDFEKEILKEIDEEEVLKEMLTEPTEQTGEMLEKSRDCYEISVEGVERKFEPGRRLGNAYNELGVFEMNQANILANASDPSYNVVAQKSSTYLTKALAEFSAIGDRTNLIICNLNLGRLHRIRAILTLRELDENPQLAKLLKTFKKFYDESLNCYKQALIMADSRNRNKDTWDTVSWELSSSTYTLCQVIFDFCSKQKICPQFERDIAESLTKAMKYCVTDPENPRQVLYTYRSGLIHELFGRLYHIVLTKSEQLTESKRRNYATLSRLHYEKGIATMESLKEYKDYFRMQNTRIFRIADVLKKLTCATVKFKTCNQVVTEFIATEGMFRSLCEAKSIPDDPSLLEEIKYFEIKLQRVLNAIFNESKRMYKGDDLKIVEYYKKTMEFTTRTNQEMTLKELAGHIAEVLKKIKQCDVGGVKIF